MSEISETEIKAMTKEQNYMRGYKDGKSDVLDKISEEIKEIKYPEGRKSCLDAEYFVNEGLDRALDVVEKYKKEGAE